MINLEFVDEDGKRVAMEYDVHPRSQEGGPIALPPGATGVIIWLGTRKGL